MTDSIQQAEITGVILAGGKARRMGGKDKGLVPLLGRPMVEYVLERLYPQVGQIVINANRNQARYAAYGVPVIADKRGDFCGPLGGMAAAMAVAQSDYLLTVPCDSPLLPRNLAHRLFSAVKGQQVKIGVVHDGARMQPVFALLHRDLAESLDTFLAIGERKVDHWYAQHEVAMVDFSDNRAAFLNVNTPAERADLEARLRAVQ